MGVRDGSDSESEGEGCVAVASGTWVEMTLRLSLSHTPNAITRESPRNILSVLLFAPGGAKSSTLLATSAMSSGSRRW